MFALAWFSCARKLRNPEETHLPDLVIASPSPMPTPSIKHESQQWERVTTATTAPFGSAMCNLYNSGLHRYLEGVLVNKSSLLWNDYNVLFGTDHMNL